MMTNSTKNDILTKEQIECVNFASGDLLIKGVAGSGKSYIILKRALKLYKENNDFETIKIFTYANSLVKYTEDLIKSKLNNNGIEVLTIDSYCLKLYKKMSKEKFYPIDDYEYIDIITKVIKKHQNTSKKEHRLYNVDVSFWKEEIKWIREKCILSKEEYFSVDRRGRGSQVRISKDERGICWEIYNLFNQQIGRKIKKDWAYIYMYLIENIENIPDQEKIDYVLIDEAQDLTVGKMKVMKALSKKSITIAADIAQKIYKTSFTWKEVGIDITGRSSKSLSKSFRSTKQIVQLAEDLMDKNRKNKNFNEDYTSAVLPEAEGPLPNLIRFGTSLAENHYLISLLRRFADNKDAVIGVICRTEKQVGILGERLRTENINYQKIEKNKEWSLLESGIKLVTAHSSKGLEFDYVIIPYLTNSNYPMLPIKIDEEQVDEFLATERSILYVAMTRARERLIMLCTDSAHSRFIEEFSKDHYKEITYE